MKIALIIVGSVLGCIALFVGFIFFATSGVAKAGNEFIDAIAARDQARIEACLAPEFLAETSWDDLDQFLTDQDLYDNQGASWHSREFQNNTGQLEGKITLKSGDQLSFRLQLLKKEDGWKILNISRNDPIPGIVSKPKLPNSQACVDLAKRTTREFAAAVAAGDFGDFHANLAPEFRSDMPLTAFTERFGQFLGQGLDLSGLNGLEPAFTADPAIDGRGVLMLEGQYLDHQPQAKFDYQFVQRGEDWQLLSIGFYIRPAEE